MKVFLAVCFEYVRLWFIERTTKPIKTHLERLPEPYRTGALRNMGEAEAWQRTRTKAGALRLAFVWRTTPEGFEFWNGLFKHLEDRHAKRVGLAFVLLSLLIILGGAFYFLNR